MKRLLSLLLCLPASHASDQLTPPQIEALTRHLSPVFTITRWASSFSADLGFIYHPSTEARQLEIEALKQRAKTHPEDAESRARLHLLLRHTSPTDAKQWHKEAETLYRQRLATNPADHASLTALAALLSGTDAAETLVLQAIREAPESWHTWHAAVRHRLQQLRLQVFAGLDGLPASGIDETRMEEALRFQSRSAERTQALLELGEQVLAHGRKAVALAPPGESVPHQELFASAAEIQLYTRALHELRGLPLPDANAFYQQALELLAKTAVTARDQPETLAVIAKLQFNNLLYSLPATASGKPDPALLEKRQAEILGPTLTRLRELCDHPDPSIAAAAAEAYCANVFFIPTFGGHPPSDDSELPALLAKAVRLDPRRAWAWDLRIYIGLKGIAGLPPSSRESPRELALERLRHLPTAHSHAILGVISEGPASLESWTQALKLEPDNVEYLLHTAAALLHEQQTPEALATVLTRLQKATSLWYANPILQEESPRLDPFRLRIFAVHQALSGNLPGARQTLAELLEQYPSDPEALLLQETLRSFP